VRRADRLFLIIHQLRGRRATPARRLADALGVSLRTVYRDVADLQRSGVPIEGEAGVGYMLRKGSDVPPLMFDREELEALVVGARLTEAFAGQRLGAAAKRALTKIEAVLPAELKVRTERSRILAPVLASRKELRERLDRLHEAIDARRVVRLDYATPSGPSTRRDVEPLCLAFWGQSWTLGGWCRMREDFRNFRLDRIGGLELLAEVAADDPARGLRAFLVSAGASPDFEI
jgi:predicted DNA-binding transcriptional regulator YafY